MDERLYALLVGVGLVDVEPECKVELEEIERVDSENIIFIECDEVINKDYTEDSFNQHSEEYLEGTDLPIEEAKETVDECVVTAIYGSDEVKDCGVDTTESSCENVEVALEELPTALECTSEEQIEHVDDLNTHDPTVDDISLDSVSIVDVNNIYVSTDSSVDIVTDSAYDLDRGKENLIDILLSFNINIDGRKKSGLGLFNFSYSSEASLGLSGDLEFDDEDIIEEVREGKKKKSNIFNLFRRK